MSGRFKEKHLIVHESVFERFFAVKNYRWTVNGFLTLLMDMWEANSDKGAEAIKSDFKRVIKNLPDSLDELEKQLDGGEKIEVSPEKLLDMERLFRVPGRPKGAKDIKPRTRRTKLELIEGGKNEA